MATLPFEGQHPGQADESVRVRVLVLGPPAEGGRMREAAHAGEAGRHCRPDEETAPRSTVEVFGGGPLDAAGEGPEGGDSGRVEAADVGQEGGDLRARDEEDADGGGRPGQEAAADRLRLELPP